MLDANVEEKVGEVNEDLRSEFDKLENRFEDSKRRIVKTCQNWIIWQKKKFQTWKTTSMNEVRIRRAQQTTSNKAEEKWEESMDWIENNYNNLKYEIREKFDKIKGNVNNDNG
jgi:uncharacterized protein YjbJ (UPF0337 family)